MSRVFQSGMMRPMPIKQSHSFQGPLLLNSPPEATAAADSVFSTRVYNLATLHAPIHMCTHTEAHVHWDINRNVYHSTGCNHEILEQPQYPSTGEWSNALYRIHALRLWWSNQNNSMYIRTDKKNLRNIILCKLDELQEEPQRMMLSFYQASWSFWIGWERLEMFYSSPNFAPG